MKNVLLNTIAIILATGVVMAGIIAALDMGYDADPRTISVQGEAMRTATPDEAEIRFSVVTEADTSSEAARANADAMSAVVEALRAYGEVETEGYYVEPVHDYAYRPIESGERDLRIQFYRARNTVVVTMTDMERVGEAIDAGTAAGANSVQGVNFLLSEETRQGIRTELLAEAGQNAKAKADAIADGLDVRVRGVHSVSEGSVHFPTFYARAEAMDMAAKETPIEPGTVEVRASVSVSYELR